jgi:hypothetical protein
MKTIPCTALVEFTVFVEGFGQVVGAPESSLDEARKPAIPEHALDRFIEGGMVKAPKGWAKANSAVKAAIADAIADGAVDGVGDTSAPADDTAGDQAPV